MKDIFPLSKAFSFVSTPGLVLVVALSFILSKAGAQVNRAVLSNTATRNVSKNDRVLRYSDFKKTALYAERIRLYRSTFNNPSKSFSMADGTSLQISFTKNPSFANQSDKVATQLSAGPSHNGSVNVPVNAASESNAGWTTGTPYHGQVLSSTVNFNITDDDSKQMSQYIFPGAVFTFDNFMNGSYQAPTGARNTIMLGTDHATSGNFIQVANPTSANIKNAIQNMVSHFTGNGNAQTSYKYYESNNMADWTLKVNAGGGGNGTNINTAFTTTDRTHHRFITIDVSKKLYSIYTNPPENGFYGATNSTEATPDLMVVGAVNYGVRLLINLELTFTNNAAAGDFKNKFNYEDYTNNLDLNYLQSHASEIASISAYEVGGSHSGTVLVNKNSLQSGINNILSSVNNQNAKPINFQLFDMAWDIIGARASTGLFNYVNSVPATPVLSSATVTIKSGNDGKNANTDFMFYVDKAYQNRQIARDSAFLKFSSPQNGHTNMPWPNHNSVTYQLQLIGRTRTLASFQDGQSRALFLDFVYGGLDVFHDNIDCQISLSLTFLVPGQSNSSRTYTLSWTDLHYANNVSHPPLYFRYQNGTFHTTTE